MNAHETFVLHAASHRPFPQLTLLIPLQHSALSLVALLLPPSSFSQLLAALPPFQALWMHARFFQASSLFLPRATPSPCFIWLARPFHPCDWQARLFHWQ
jgi:hypothetical protein